MSKTVHIEYFAQLREQAGMDKESLQVNCENYSELYDLLKDQYQFTLDKESLKLSVNESFESFDREILDGDHVVFIAPVAGGRSP